MSFLTVLNQRQFTFDEKRLCDEFPDLFHVYSKINITEYFELKIGQTKYLASKFNIWWVFNTNIWKKITIFILYMLFSIFTANSLFYVEQFFHIHRSNASNFNGISHERKPDFFGWNFYLNSVNDMQHTKGENLTLKINFWPLVWTKLHYMDIFLKKNQQNINKIK